MVPADNMSAVLREKFTVREIQGERQVAATVFIRNEFSSEPRDESFGGLPIFRELKFARAPFVQIAELADFYLIHRETIQFRRAQGKAVCRKEAKSWLEFGGLPDTFSVIYEDMA